MGTYSERKIEICGYKVRVCNFSYASYYYPEFNQNAEFKVSSEGFRQLSHYLRNVTYFRNLTNSYLEKLEL